MAKFSDKDTFKFIALYRSESCLWNTDRSEYKDMAKRKAALERIINEMNIPNFSIADLKNKIKNIRSHYCQELKKIKDSGNIYKPSLVWFEALDEFLRNYVQLSSDSMPQKKRKHEEKEVLTFEESFTDGEITIKDEPITYDALEIGHSTERFSDMMKTDIDRDIVSNYTTDSYQPQKRNRKEFSRSGVSMALEKLEEMLERTNTKKTEFDVFGSSVAAQLNAMVWENAIDLQMQIQQLITRYRLKVHYQFVNMQTGTLDGMPPGFSGMTSQPTSSNANSAFAPSSLIDTSNTIVASSSNINCELSD